MPKHIHFNEDNVDASVRFIAAYNKHILPRSDIITLMRMNMLDNMKSIANNIDEYSSVCTSGYIITCDDSWVENENTLTGSGEMHFNFSVFVDPSIMIDSDEDSYMTLVIN